VFSILAAVVFAALGTCKVSAKKDLLNYGLFQYFLSSMWRTITKNTWQHFSVTRILRCLNGNNMMR